MPWEVTMTAAPTTRHGGGSRDYDSGRGSGLVAFAAALLAVLGFFNLLDGIAAIARSHVFIANAHFVIGSLRAWGWIIMILGVLQLFAAGGVITGNPLARWFGVIVVGLNAIGQMFFLASYPFWSSLIIIIDIAALYGLCAYDSRESRRGTRAA
ncbi:MAG TPA: hypothetical protein DEH11_00710 [Actinobacteria bacterium]|jgi:hypothetical protein|nr:hypothetical protein [Actinomycetota bacterium]